MSSGRTQLLHIEDNKDIRAFVASVLQDIADITYAKNMANAREKLAEAQFDIVILDLVLPDGSGLDLIHELKQQDPPLPIIIHSSHEVSDNIKGVDAVLSKLHTTEEDLHELVCRLATK